MRAHHRLLPTLAAALGAVSLLVGLCACTVAEPAAEPASIRALGAGFLGDAALGESGVPAPESTIQPIPGSWDGVVPPAGFRVVLLSSGVSPSTDVLVGATRMWALEHDVIIREVNAPTDSDLEAAIVEASAGRPDLVIGAGSGIVDVFGLLTSQHLAQRFLVIGAELPEPTANVTAVVWPGASFRGSGLGSVGDEDPTAVTPARADAALSAGVASVLHDLTGIVIDLQ